MFAKLFTTALLASSVMGAVLPRDLPTITNAMTSIGDGIEKLTADITAWDGKAAGAATIDTDSKALQKTISDSTAAIKAGTPIQLMESISLLGATNALNAKTDALADAMIAAKPKYDALGITKQVADGITAQTGSSAALKEAIFSKLPALAQTIGQQAAGQVTGKLDQAVAILKGEAPAVAPAAPAESA